MISTQELAAQNHDQHAHHNMTLNDDGMVMYANNDVLPRGCDAIGPDVELDISAGSRYATDAPGTIFGMSQHEVKVSPCTRLTVNFTNEDEVRHQWMVHGLPKYLYPAGMFHLEAMAGKTITGTFIVPPDDRTYLIHCDMAQHMEKGMKGQLVVGNGSGNLWSVKGISDPFNRAPYLPSSVWWLVIIALLLPVITSRFLGRATVIKQQRQPEIPPDNPD
ncbi:MAG: plastocyanin [Halieaceae bacterium]|jgi:plastocyanin